MSKSLEELNKIKKLDILYDIEMTESAEEYLKEKGIDLDIIEKDLKKLEKMQEIRYIFLSGRCSGKSAKLNILKKLTALEIIKNKRVDTRALIEILEDGWTWEQYMDEEDDINTGGHQFSRDRLTQEEYDLLREVLL